MGDPSSGNKNGGSFMKFLSSPARTDTKKSSSNPLSKLLRRRRSSRRADEDGGSISAKGVDNEFVEENESPNLVEEVKEVVGTTIDHVFHDEEQDASIKQTIEDVTSIGSKETEETNHQLIGKFKEELGKAEEEFKGEFDKAKEESEILAHKKELLHDHHQPVDKKPDVEISKGNKSMVEELKPPLTTIPQTLQDEVVNVVSTVDSKIGEPRLEGEVDKEKKEENCVSSLAQGLQKLCVPWSSK